MIHFRMIGHIARCEARLLQRSWAFRISLGIALFYLVMFNIIMNSPQTHVPHHMVALAGALPLGNIKLLNVYLGAMAALLATEFYKRDHRDDTAQTAFVHSYTNLDYIIGKVLGVATVFGVLELIVLAVAAVLHQIFAPVPLTWQPYAMAILVAAVPTMALTTGLAVLLVSILRSQAVVLVLVVGLGAGSLIWAGYRYFYFFDLFAFHIPMMWSGFVGAGNERQLLLVRGTHLLFGLACIATAPLLVRRLPQSRLAVAASCGAAIACAAGAAWTGKTYLSEQLEARDYRQTLRETSAAAAQRPAPTMASCALAVEHLGRGLSVAADLVLVNDHEAGLDTLLLTLNPGLSLRDLTVAGESLKHHREEHLVHILPGAALAPGDSLQVRMVYTGEIDERLCYLDVEQERHEAQYRLWLHSVPKRYASVTPGYLHLTPESGWYPRAGMPPGTAFPAAGHRDYTRYDLSVVVPEGWTAFSQGVVQVDTLTRRYHFRADYPLSQLSLTMGPYEVRQLEVGGVTYSLAIRPGHNYFDTYLDSVTGVLPELITELRNEYEVALGLEYPYPRLTLVETPIQIYAYQRLWSVAQETVQPEILFMPEMGALCEGCDFRRQKRRSRRSQEWANQAETAQALQRDYLRTFAVLDLLGTKIPAWRRVPDEVETGYKLLPMFVSHLSHIASQRWPLVNYAFESYFKERVEPPQNTRHRRWSGLTLAERANLMLKENSLADLIADTELPRDIRGAAIQAKGRQLVQLFAAKADGDFDAVMAATVTASYNRGLSEAEVIELLGGSELDPESVIDDWYRRSDLPGYEVGVTESYLVRDGERTRTQVEFEVSNPTAVDGLIEVGFRERASGTRPFWFDRQGEWLDHSTVIAMPAGTRKRVGILLANQTAEMVLDTYVSRNIPSLISVPFGDQKLRRKVRPFEGEEMQLLADEPPPAFAQYVVDNEDEGFEVHETEQANPLRRLLVDLFDLRQRDSPYVSMRTYDPPGTWAATTERRFYGRFVLSGHYKRAGDGRSIVSWRTEIEREGDYEIYYFVGAPDEQRHSRRHGSWRRGKSTMDLKVYHESGVEAVDLDADQAAEGWNYIGTYRLAAGPAHVELSDRAPGGAVVADAVKWVERL